MSFTSKRMQRTVCLLAVVLIAGVAAGHDLFLKLDSYFLQPHSSARVLFLNGTFSRSDGAIARSRFRDVSVVANGSRQVGVESFSWQDEDKTTVMEIKTGAPGTYAVGASTTPREIDLTAAEFNDYLSHDGIPDTLAERRRDQELGKDVRERYSKHVRAIFQVGDQLTEDYKTAFGYPVEIIPQQNPYALRPGQTLAVLCVLDGKPLVSQFVMAGWESAGGQLRTLTARTDPKGFARFKLVGAGKWYVKFIHMTKLADVNLNYESKWATLTFAVKK